MPELSIPTPSLDASSLHRSITTLFATAGGRFAVAGKNLDTGEQVLISADEIFPAASVIKVFVMGAVFGARDEGLLALNEKLELKPEEVVGGSGILVEMEPGLQLSLIVLTRLMIVTSDNTATNMLINRIGLPYFEEFLQRNAFKDIRLQRLLFDLDARKQGRDNLITARESALAVEMLHKSSMEPLSAASCRECIEIMRRQQYRDKIPRMLPRNAKIANKTGGLRDASHDLALVEAPDGPTYTISILTADFASEFEADLAISRTSRAIWDYFTT